MTTEKTIRKHVIQYLCDKGYEKSQIKEEYKISFENICLRDYLKNSLFVNNS